MYITTHARNRFFERTPYKTVSDQDKAVEYVLANGLKINKFEGEFYDFLCSKQLDYGKNTLYVSAELNIILILDNIKKCVCTIYTIPGNFLPINKYLLKENKRCFIAVFDDANGTYEYVADGVLTDDIGLATEFKSVERAMNCIKNNRTVALRKIQGCDVEIIEL